MTLSTGVQPAPKLITVRSPVGNAVGDLGLGIQVATDLGMVSQSQTGSIRRLHQDTGVETKCRIVTVAFEFSIIATWAEWVGHHAGYLTADAVDRRPKTDRHGVVESQAEFGRHRRSFEARPSTSAARPCGETDCASREVW